MHKAFHTSYQVMHTCVIHLFERKKLFHLSDQNPFSLIWMVIESFCFRRKTIKRETRLSWWCFSN